MSANARYDEVSGLDAQRRPGQRSPAEQENRGQFAAILGLQRSAGNSAVAQHLARYRPPGSARRPAAVLDLQRCGPTPCDCSDEDQADYATKHPEDPAGSRSGMYSVGVQRCGCGDEPPPASSGIHPRSTALQLQRWPFGDDSEETASDEGGGVLGWIGQQVGSVTDTVSSAAGSVADTVSGAAGSVADTASGAAGSVVDTASGAAGSVVDTASDAAGGAVDWAKQQGAAAADAVLAGKRTGALAQIASARSQLNSVQGALPVSDGQLGTINGHIAKLAAASGAAVPQLSASDAGDGSGNTVSVGAIDGLLASLQSAIPAPAGGTTAQRSVQRLLDPQAAAAAEAALAAAAAAAEAGAIPATGAAPETFGLSYVVLAIIVVIVLIVVAIIVYATYKKPEPAPTPTPGPPEMPEGLSREKKEKWKKCQELYETYKQGTGKDVSNVATEINELRGKYNSLSPEEKKQLCAKVFKQLELVQRLINDRRDYIDNGCDEFDWFKQGKTEDERRRKHEGEVNNVKAQEANLRGLLRRLQDEGVC